MKKDLESKFSMYGRILRAAIFSVFVMTTAAIAVSAAATAPVLWTAGGLSAGTDSAGQAAKITTDIAGNVAVVSGPALGRGLAVTSYTSAGALRWRQIINPASGTFAGLWIEAAPNGDFVAVGTNLSSRGSIVGATIVRYSNDGALISRVDTSTTVLSVGRLLVDASSNAYFSVNSLLTKYSPTGAALWTSTLATTVGSAALSPDGTDLVITGGAGGNWRTQVLDTATGAQRWLVVAPEGISANDVVVDGGKIFVTGQGYTGASTPQLAYYLTVVAYDRATGARLWRTDKNPVGGTNSAGLRMAKTSDGGIVVAGQTLRGFLDWYTVSFSATGAVRWEAVRDGGLNTDEIPRGIIVLPNGTTVVTGVGGPALAGGFIQGVSAGYNSGGVLLWEGFSAQATTWATTLPSGDFCAAGGYDALITCFDVPSGGFGTGFPNALIVATPTSGNAPLNVSFDGRASSGSSPITGWDWNFGDGTTGSGSLVSHVYTTPGTYNATLVVTDGAFQSFPRTVTITVNQAPPVKTPPTAPSGLTATALSRTSIALAWTNTSTDQTSVLIERCKGATCTNYAQITTVGGTVSSFTNTGLSSNTSYSYRVRAVNAAGNSGYSNLARAKTRK